jgi:hypothetical protein
VEETNEGIEVLEEGDEDVDEMRERESEQEKRVKRREQRVGLHTFIAFISNPDHPSDQRLTIFWTWQTCLKSVARVSKTWPNIISPSLIFQFQPFYKLIHLYYKLTFMICCK